MKKCIMIPILIKRARLLFLTTQIIATIFGAAKAQSNSLVFPSYILSQSGNSNVNLHQFNNNTGYWDVLGSTGKDNIRSIAIVNGQIYTVAGGTLGTLNPVTGQFIAVGNIGTANGANGSIVIDNVFGLTYNENDNYFYATHRTSDDDLLLKINPTTGKRIKNSLRNDNGNFVDYKTLNISTFYFGQYFTSKKFNDLAYDNSTGSLFLSHNYFSNLSEIIELVNVDSQNYTTDFKMSPIQNLYGIAFDDDSHICGTFSNNKISDPYDVNGPAVVNTFVISANNVIDPSQTSGTSFYSLGFSRCVIDLNVNSPLTTTNSVQFASSTVTSNITLNKSTTFVAGAIVSLNKYFHVPKHINFEAKIDHLCD